MDVFDHHQADEVLIGILVVEGEADEGAQRRFRLDMIEIKRRLDLADAAVGVFEHLDEQAFLVAEIVIDHPLAGAGARRDVVDARATEALVRELIGCDVEDVAAGSLGVLTPPLDGRGRAAPMISPLWPRTVCTRGARRSHHPCLRRIRHVYL